MSWKIFETVTLSVFIIGLLLKTSIFFAIFEILAIAIMVTGLYQKNTNLMCKSKKSLFGRTVIVTGGTSGMGLQIAIDFAQRGARVIIACPFEDEGLHAKEQIEKKAGSNKVIFKILDLSSFESVRKFATDILETEERLDILLNNAGVGLPGDFLSSDKIHFVMQVNYYGTVLLTLLLLPLLQKTGQPSEPSRIVNTSSVMHKLGKIDFENWNRTNYWSKTRLYANSKLCLVMFTQELSKKLKDNVIVHSVDPGIVGTAIFRSVGLSFGTLWTFLIGIIFKNPWEGSQTALHVCLSDTAKKSSGKYFRNLKVISPGKLACDEYTSKRVWEHSLEIVKLSENDLKACNNKKTYRKVVSNGGV